MSNETAGFAERSVLGSLLIAGQTENSELVAKILAEVRSADFFDETNKHLFEAARALYREGAPIDPVTVLGKLGLDRDNAARAGVAKLLEDTPTTANWREYATLMHDNAVLAHLQAEAIALTQCRTLDDCREHVAAIESTFHAGHRISSKTLEQLYAEFAERQKPDAEIKARYPIGISRIDRKAKLSEGKLVCIGGLPSGGKTALAIQWGVETAKLAPTGIFSMETDDETVGDRIVTHTTQIDYEHIVDQHLTNRDWAIFADKMPLYARRNLRVFDESRLTVDQIAAISTAYGLKIVFIDYGQLIETDHDKNATRAEQLARVSIALKQFARSTNTLVVVLLQLKEPRKYKGADGKIKTAAPTMEDIGESRQWMKDADVMFIISRPDDTTDNDYVEKLSYDKHRILKIAKNKEGHCGTVTLTFDGEHQTFYVKGTEPDAKSGKARDKEMVGQQSLDELPDEQEEGMPF